MTDFNTNNVVKDADGTLYVDTNFVNNCQGNIIHSELKHLGYGDFMLWTPNGDVTFSRNDYKHFDGFVGRTHQMTDNRDGVLIDKLITAMDCQIIEI